MFGRILATVHDAWRTSSVSFTPILDPGSTLFASPSPYVFLLFLLSPLPFSFAPPLSSVRSVAPENVKSATVAALLVPPVPPVHLAAASAGNDSDNNAAGNGRAAVGAAYRLP